CTRCRTTGWARFRAWWWQHWGTSLPPTRGATRCGRYLTQREPTIGLEPKTSQSRLGGAPACPDLVSQGSIALEADLQGLLETPALGFVETRAGEGVRQAVEATHTFLRGVGVDIAGAIAQVLHQAGGGVADGQGHGVRRPLLDRLHGGSEPFVEGVALGRQ